MNNDLTYFYLFFLNVLTKYLVTFIIKTIYRIKFKRTSKTMHNYITSMNILLGKKNNNRNYNVHP